MSKTKKITSVAGTLLMAVSLVFIARRLAAEEIDFSVLTSPWVIAGLFAVILVNGLIMLASAINYRAWVRNTSGAAVPAPLAMTVYCSSNLYKYIPGSVLFILGRHKLVIEKEALRHGQVAFATGLEFAVTAIAAAVIALAAARNYFSAVFAQIEVSATALALAAALAILAVFIAYLFRGRIAAWFKRVREEGQALKLTELAKRMLFALIMVFLWGAVFLSVTALLGLPLTPSLAVTIIGLYISAWIFGVIIPGVPGGLGVREAALLFLMGGVVCESVLLSAIVTHRLLVVAGDVIAYGMAAVYARIRRSART